MADTPKKVIRLIDNIKLELYEEGKKKYAQIWDPTGNNTYNEDDGGPSGIKSPERSKKMSSAEPDENIIRYAIKNSQIVEHYRVEAKRSSNGKDKDIEPYFTYLQDPFRETPPPKRIYGGGGLGTPEVDNVGPTPYYLNNGCKVNIKWIGMIPNPDFQLGTFSTPTAQDRYNLSLNPSGPPRYLYDKPILSDVDNTFGKKISDDDFTKHLRPQSEWFIYPANAAISETIGPIDEITGITFSVNYKDKPILMDKIVSITLPTGFTENGGKGYLQWIGPGEDKGLVYSTAQKTFTSKENNPLLKKFASTDSGIETDKNILYTIIQSYKKQVASVSREGGEADSVSVDYDLKVCFPDTEACSPIPYRSPITLPSASLIATTASVASVAPVLTPKKVKLNVFGLPGVTSLSGETDGTIKVKVKVSLPDFTVYLGDPPGSTNSDASGLNPFGLVEDDVENPDPYEETPFVGAEEGGERFFTAIQQDEQTAAVEEQTKVAEKQNTEEAAASGTEKLPDGLKSLGTYYSEFPADSAKGGLVPSGFNGVPYYHQFDGRWGNVVFGPAEGGGFVEAKILPRLNSKANPPTNKRVSVNWESKTYVVFCDHKNGDNGYSDIHRGGCGITSISMIINYWSKKGKTGGKSTSPVKVAKMACDTGARPKANPATNGTQPGKETSAFSKAIKTHFGLIMRPATAAEARKLLLANNPVLFCGTNFAGKGADNKNSYNYGGHFIAFTGCDSTGKWRVNDPGIATPGGGISYFDKFPDEKGFIGSGNFWAIGPPDVVKPT